jgi:hypothetical protein
MLVANLHIAIMKYNRIPPAERLPLAERLARFGGAVLDACSGINFGYALTPHIVSERRELQLAIAQLQSHANDPVQHRNPDLG